MFDRTEKLKNGAVVYTSAGFSFGYDALLLADFLPLKPSSRILEIGSGCGIIPLYLADRGHTGDIVGIEISRRGAELFERAAKENGFANVRAVCADINKCRAGKKFDAVVCNPPYFSTGRNSQNIFRALARHEIALDLDDVCRRARSLLKQQGSLCVCYHPERLSDLFAKMHDYRLEPKRLRLVKNDAADAEPWLVLVDARLDGGVGLSFLPDLIIRGDGPDGYSPKMARILGLDGPDAPAAEPNGAEPQEQ